MEIAHAAEESGDRDHLNKLVESNLSFVVRIASEYRNMTLPFEDLVSEGNVGLLEAARRYDRAKGTKFITYAVWWVRKSILKALSEQSNLVRVPDYQMKRVRRVRETEAGLQGELGRSPGREEISSRLRITIHEIDQILSGANARTSCGRSFHCWTSAKGSWSRTATGCRAAARSPSGRSVRRWA